MFGDRTRMDAYAVGTTIWSVVALKGTLPESVRLRPKAPLAGDPLIGFFRERNLEWVDSFEPLPELNRYVDRGKMPRIKGDQSSEKRVDESAPLYAQPLAPSRRAAMINQ